MPVYSFNALRPRIASTAYVHPDAVLIGDVLIGPDSSVWPGAVLRGDHGSIAVGARTSIQDGTVIHTTKSSPTAIGDDCVVGHNAHLEGCVVEDRCLIGSMSTVLGQVRIGAESVVGAAALVPEGMAVQPGSKLLGVPARVRPLDRAAHRRWIEYAVGLYMAHAANYPSAMARVELADCRG